MTEENTQTPAAEAVAPQTATSELQPGTAPVDGGEAVAGAETQPETQQPNPEGEGESDEQRNKKRERFDKRFSDLSRARHEAELRAARLEGELAALRRMPAQAEPAPQAPPQPAGPPKPEDYPEGKYAAEYAIDMADWRAQERERVARETAETTAREAAEHREVQEGRSRWEGVCVQARDAGDGFDNAETVLLSPNVPRATMDLITTAENPIHVAEWFGRNPDALRNIVGQSVVEQARAVAKLDTIISTNLKARASAPAPAAAPRPAPTPSPAAMPTAPAGGGSLQFNPERASFEEFQAYARKVREAAARPNGAG